MKKIIRDIALLAVSVLGIIAFLVLWPKLSPSQPQIISTSFVGYDFARAVLTNKNAAAMLLKPGAEVHDYEPSPQDIIDIKNAKLFIYTGGESDQWVENLLGDNDIPKERTLRLMDYVELKTEAIKEGMEAEEEGDGEYDEHIWTSPKNAIKLVEAVRDKLVELEPALAEDYRKNADSYLERLKNIDDLLGRIAKNAPQKTLIFGDRFPFRYFVDEFGLDYYAAFPGCADQTEASSSTVAFLIKKAKKTHARAIFKTELSNGQLAKTIADEAGAQVYELSAAHNISEHDFNNGTTYADLMERNAAVLQEVLY